MLNRLSREHSLYLRQHSENPVQWYPWGEAAFKAAEVENKPLLISIGYSACHWCHVMAHESFEDPYIGDLMNQHFICIKVDREERPDVDQVYMEAVQMLQQRGGWPLNVFCLPDGRPFFGGTYFPPEDRGQGLIPWPQLLMRIADHYKHSCQDLEENAEAICKNIMAGAQVSGTTWRDEILLEVAHGICKNHDDAYGGFGEAPKFPPSMTLNFLKAICGMAPFPEGNSQLADRIDEVYHTTLRAMAHGGIYDQFGGGFARYSVDAHWLIPHFEKMLYDNALLIDAYVRGWLDCKEPLYAAVVEETIDWLEREMSADCGAFYSSLDADSEGGEGRYYVWKPEEVVAVLGSSAAREVCAAYNITEAGNFEEGYSNPALVEPDFVVREQLAGLRKKLREHRESERVAPSKDTKINLSWNCLLIRALADAGFYFDRPEWFDRARRAIDFIWKSMAEVSVDGVVSLKSVYYEGADSRIDGFLHDYALAAEANLAVASKVDWLDPGASIIYRDRAYGCLKTALKEFKDPASMGYFYTAESVETPVARCKEWLDNAMPSGNSALLHALTSACVLTGEEIYSDAIGSLLPAYADHAGKFSAGVAHALEAAVVHGQGVFLIKVIRGQSLDALRDALSKRPWRRIFIETVEVGSLSGAYQLCAGHQCYPPVNTVEELFNEI